MPKKQRPYPLIHAPLAAPYPPVRQACRSQLQPQCSSQNSVPRTYAFTQQQLSSPPLVSQSSFTQQDKAHLWTNATPTSVPMTREVKAIPPHWPNFYQIPIAQRQKKDVEDSDYHSTHHRVSPLEHEEHTKVHSASPRSSVEPTSIESEKPGAVLRKGRWSRAEDERLMASIELYGPNKWKAVASDVGTRTGDQCWKRWNDSLDSTLKHDPWTEKEDENLLKAVRELGRAWSRIATERLNGRSGLSCKNRIDHLNRRHRRVMNFNSGHILHKLNVAMNRGGCVSNVTLMQKKDSLQHHPADVMVHTTLTPFDTAQAAANQTSAREVSADQEAANAMYNSIRYDPMMPFSLTHNRDNVQANLDTSAAMAAVAAGSNSMDPVLSLEENGNAFSQSGASINQKSNMDAEFTVSHYASTSANAKPSHPRSEQMAFNPHSINFDDSYRKMIQHANQVYRGRYPTVRHPLPSSGNTKDGHWENAYDFTSMHANPIEANTLASGSASTATMVQQSPVLSSSGNVNGHMTEVYDPINPSLGHAQINRPIDANTYVFNGMSHVVRPSLYPSVPMGNNTVQYASSSYPSSQHSNISMMSSPISEMSQTAWNIPRDANRGQRNPLDIAALTSPTNIEPMGATSSRRPTNFIDKNRLDASYYATAHHAASIAHLISPEIPASVDKQLSSREEDLQSGISQSTTSFSFDSQQQSRGNERASQDSVIHQNVHIQGYDDSEFVVHQNGNIGTKSELEGNLMLEACRSSGQGSDST